LTVTSTGDSGPGSLRAAMAAAKDGDSILFNLPRPSTIQLSSGTLTTAAHISIVGPGPSALTVAGNGSFAVFSFPYPCDISMSGLTVRGGAEANNDGGGIFADGDLRLTNCIVSQNSARYGGGIYDAGGTLTIVDSIISSNQAQVGGGLFCGGASLIVHSTISGNQAVETVTNAPAAGGGILAQGPVTIERSVVSNNSALGTLAGGPAEGGGIDNHAALAIIDSTISGNLAQGGPVIDNTGTNGSGGGIYNYDTLSIVGSTLDHNQAIGGSVSLNTGGYAAGDGSGGAIQVNISGSGFTTNCVITNSTFFANSAEGGDGGAGKGGLAFGGGIMEHSTVSFMSIINCTIFQNSAHVSVGQQGFGLSYAGGLYSGSNSDLVRNTIIAGNTASVGPDTQSPGDGVSYSLIGNVDGSGITTNNGNQVGTAASPIDPMLGLLQNNGGLTKTLALLAGSPAIDAGTTAGVTSSTDQRGFNRIAGRTIDIGAVEFEPIHLVAAGAGYGGAPEVKVYDLATGQLKLDFLAYEASFHGGVRVAMADINGDGVPDIITAPGGVKVSLVNVNGALVPSFDLSAGRAPEIKVFSGVDGTRLADFLAYDSSFKAGVFVAAADMNGDGKPDIITGPDATGQSGHTNVGVFLNGDLINTGGAGILFRQFNAYDPGFGGGVRLAAGDLNRDGIADIVTAPGIWSGPDIRVFDGKSLFSFNPSRIGEFLAYDYRYFGGVFVATGDVNGDGRADIVTGTNGNGGPEVKAFDGQTIGVNTPPARVLDDFFAYSPLFNGGSTVAVADVNGDGIADIITGAGPGGGPHVRIFDGGTGLQLQQNTTDSFMAFDPSFSGGVFVGGA
jgi:hypothetical protein